MKCDIFREQMHFYIDGTLDKDSQEQLLFHVQQCQECLKLLEEMQDLVSEMHNLTEIELPQGFHNKWIRKLHNEESSFKKLFNIRTAAAVASILVILWAGFEGRRFLNQMNPSKVADESQIHSNQYNDQFRQEDSINRAADMKKQESAMVPERADEAELGIAAKESSEMNKGDEKTECPIIYLYTKHVDIDQSHLHDYLINEQYEILNEENNSILVQLKTGENIKLLDYLKSLGQVRGEIPQERSKIWIHLVMDSD